jgi:hypothetical protein
MIVEETSQHKQQTIGHIEGGEHEIEQEDDQEGEDEMMDLTPEQQQQLM